MLFWIFKLFLYRELINFWVQMYSSKLDIIHLWASFYMVLSGLKLYLQEIKNENNTFQFTHSWVRR